MGKTEPEGKSMSEKEFNDRIRISRPPQLANPLFPKIKNVLDYKKQVILYGPPGTGKTWVANNFIKSKIMPEIITREVARKDRKFFWYSVLDSGADDLAEYLRNDEGDTEGVGVHGDISNAYGKIEEGDIVFVYGIRESRIIGICLCTGKYWPPESKIWDVSLILIKSVQDPSWNNIENDLILKNSEPVKYYESKKNTVNPQDLVMDQPPPPQKMLWNAMFPLTQEEGMRLLELSQVSLNELDKIPVNDTKMITTDKKFFWFTTKLESWDKPQTLDVFLENQEESEIWYGKLASAYEEIEAGSIVLIYVPGKDRRLYGVATCVRKGVDENGKPDVILKGIKSVQGPLWKTIVEDPILRNSKPVKMNALGTLFPLTYEEGIHLIELAQVPLNDLDKIPEKDLKMIAPEIKFFWYPTKSMIINNHLPPLDLSLSSGQEGSIWFEKLNNAYNEIRVGDILIFYAGKPNISWIVTCLRKEFSSVGNSRIIVKGIKDFQSPPKTVIKNDALLTDALPLNESDLDVFYPITQEAASRFLELTHISMEEIIDVGIQTKARERDHNQEKNVTIHLNNFVTFHPSYAYEEFIEGLRPNADDKGNIRYEIQEGIFKRASREALNALLEVAEIDRRWEDQFPVPIFSHEETVKIQSVVDWVPCYLVIDEINRGDISRIFGELITLVESDKRLFCENEIRCILPYSKMEFGIPPNLYIIGTMNTADRSISLMDIALRRRFGFIELLPDYDALKKILITDASRSEEVKGYRDIAIQSLQKMNERLTEKYDRDHQIGHSYLVKLSQDTSVEDTKETLTNIWKYEIIPLLQEYFYDSPEKLLYITNNRFFEKSGSSFVLKTEGDIIEALRAVTMTK